MLTDKAVRAAAAKEKAYKLTDSRGLYLYVSEKGHKSWRYKYRFEKKERLLTLGTYPEVSLAEAREKRDEAKKILREGRDPRLVVRRGRPCLCIGIDIRRVDRVRHGLRSYRAAMDELANAEKQGGRGWANDRVENSYLLF
ncbi:Arm DNA-binding domain-containing protein [Erythrobacter westpacificensis]